MFASVIKYRLNPIFENDFIRSWKRQRDLLRKMEIISTCVLHRETKISYIGYTRWDSKQSFYDYILDPQDEFKELQQKIEESCNDLQVMHRMEILQDLDGNA